MKRVFFLLVLLMLVTVAAFGEDIDSIFPDNSIWGTSSNDFIENISTNYIQCLVGEDKGLYVPDVEVCSYNMDVYYIFGEKIETSTGKTYAGLSKIAYIMNDDKVSDKSKLEECRQFFIDEMTKILGEPDTVKKNTTRWEKDKYRVEISKGKFEKYNGGKKTTVGMFFKMGTFKKVTKTPKPEKTPKPTNTPKPEYGKIDYQGVSRHPENYKGNYVKFTGIVVQAQETYGEKYDGGSLFDEYYVLRVASKYEKYEYIDGYDTDDIVYVVVPTSKVEGGRILDEDKVKVYGRYDGIETYTTILGARISIPRIEADRVIIK